MTSTYWKNSQDYESKRKYGEEAVSRLKSDLRRSTRSVTPRTEAELADVGMVHGIAISSM